MKPICSFNYSQHKIQEQFLSVPNLPLPHCKDCRFLSPVYQQLLFCSIFSHTVSHGCSVSLHRHPLTQLFPLELPILLTHSLSHNPNLHSVLWPSRLLPTLRLSLFLCFTPSPPALTALSTPSICPTLDPVPSGWFFPLH